MDLQQQKEDIIISTDKSLLDINFIHQFLTNCYWSPGISLNLVRKAIDGSMSFGIYKNSKQIGFARVITDQATFAYLADVFIDPAEREKGYSKQLMQFIMNHEQLQGLRRFLLATKDAHGLYAQFGFTSLSSPERWMQIHNANAYKIK